MSKYIAGDFWITRCGFRARIDKVIQDEKKYPIKGVVFEESGLVGLSWTIDGCVFLHESSNYDLMSQRQAAPQKVPEPSSKAPVCPFEVGKEYLTLNGLRAKIYALNGAGCFPIHGAIFDRADGWRFQSWTLNGNQVNGSVSCKYDLMPPVVAKHRIQKTYWVNVYKNDCCSIHLSDEYAASSRTKDCLATVKIDIDCFEGDGL